MPGNSIDRDKPLSKSCKCCSSVLRVLGRLSTAGACEHHLCGHSSGARGMSTPVPPQVSSLFYVPTRCSAECKTDPNEALAGCWGAFLRCGCIHTLPLGQRTDSGLHIGICILTTNNFHSSVFFWTLFFPPTVKHPQINFWYAEGWMRIMQTILKLGGYGRHRGSRCSLEQGTSEEAKVSGFDNHINNWDIARKSKV